MHFTGKYLWFWFNKNNLVAIFICLRTEPQLYGFDPLKRSWSWYPFIWKLNQTGKSEWSWFTENWFVWELDYTLCFRLLIHKNKLTYSWLWTPHIFHNITRNVHRLKYILKTKPRLRAIWIWLWTILCECVCVCVCVCIFPFLNCHTVLRDKCTL